MRVYVDSAIFIYCIEGLELIQQLAMARITHIIDSGGTAIYSDLTRLECRVKPLRNSDFQLLALYDDFFLTTDFIKAPITTQVFDRATVVRAEYSLRTPDAIHLAVALVAGCDLLLTNDLRFSKCAALPIEVLT
jgi:uncharacterized protein